MKIDGGCFCGAISFEAEVDPETASICHCTDCQELTGTAFRTSVQATADKFRITSGEPTIYVKTAESGSKRIQAFCGTCGSHIYATAHGDPGAPYNIRTGIVRQRDRLVPKIQIWARSAQKWLGDIAGMPALEKNPRR